MKYFVPLFDGVIYGEKPQQFFRGCKYLIKDASKAEIIFNTKNNSCSVLNFNSLNENVLKVQSGADDFYFLFETNRSCGEVVEVDFKNRRFIISLLGGIKITENGQWICDINVDKVKFSHYEEIENLLILYFTGVREFVVVIKETEVEYFGYIDECNITDNEKYFLEKHCSKSSKIKE